jgi:hypothetical protein
MPPRQARLRSTYSEWYAGIAPGTWHHALWVREKALANLRHGRPQWENTAHERILSDSHFEFQGGTVGEDAPRRERRMTLREK